MITGDGEMNEYSHRTCPEIVSSNNQIYSLVLLLRRGELPAWVFLSVLQRGAKPRAVWSGSFLSFVVLRANVPVAGGSPSPS